MGPKQLPLSLMPWAGSDCHCGHHLIEGTTRLWCLFVTCEHFLSLYFLVWKCLGMLCGKNIVRLTCLLNGNTQLWPLGVSVGRGCNKRAHGPLLRRTCQAQTPHVVWCLQNTSVVCSPYALVVLVHLVQLVTVWTNVSLFAFTWAL